MNTPKASVEDALRALLESYERRRAMSDSLFARKPITETDIQEHHEALGRERARFDVWLSESGWTMAEVGRVVGDLSKQVDVLAGRRNAS